jgi:hypothetical protein
MYVLNMLGFTHHMWTRAISKGVGFTATLGSRWTYFTVIDGDTSVEQRLNGITVDLRVRILKTNPNAINLRQSE